MGLYSAQNVIDMAHLKMDRARAKDLRFICPEIKEKLN